jgi:hypothetical protein
MEVITTLTLDAVKFSNAVKAYKQRFKLKKKPLLDEDINWLVTEINRLAFVIEMLVDNDEIELEQLAADSYDILEDEQKLTYTSLKNTKSGTKF